MFGNILKKINKVVDETEQIDDRFYAEVIDELGQGFKDKAAVGKAIAQCNGNETMFDSLYMKIRAQALQEKNRRNSKQPQERKILLKSLKRRYERGHFSVLLRDEIKSKGYSTYFLGGVNDFEKDNKQLYYGIMDFETMHYIIINRYNKKEMHRFKIDESLLS